MKIPPPSRDAPTSFNTSNLSMARSTRSRTPTAWLPRILSMRCVAGPQYSIPLFHDAPQRARCWTREGAAEAHDNLRARDLPAG